MDERTRPKATRSVLGRRDYRLLLASFGVSRAGDFVYITALIVYVYDATGSAAWVSATTLLRLLPYAVLSPLAGMVTDRYERRLLMVISQLVQLVLMVGLTVAAAVSASAALVIMLSFLVTVAATVSLPAVTAMTQEVVPEDELAAANSLISTVDSVAYIAGPAAGGLLLLLGAPAVAFGLNAATFAVSALCLVMVRHRSQASRGGKGGGAARELRDGLAALFADRTIIVLVGCLVASTVVYGVELVLLVQVSSRLLGMGSSGLGWLSACVGAGGLFGAVLSGRLADMTRPRAMICVIVALNGAPMAALAFIKAPVVAFVVLLAEGAAVVVLDVLVETAMQRSVASELMGRVAGLVGSLTVTGTLVGSLLAPVLVGLVGLRAGLVLAGLVPVTIAALSVLRLSGLDTASARAKAEVAPRVEILRLLRFADGAEPAALERLAMEASTERVSAGQTVMRQGDAADDLFVLVEGRMVVDHVSGGVVTRLNEMVGPDYYGEIGLLRGTPRTASVTAVEDSVVWRIPGRAFVDAVSATPTLSPGLSAGMRSRLERTPQPT